MKTEIPLVIGHRGAAGHAPENTISGLKTAAALGVTWVEFDVRLTRDLQAVLFHDESLERTTNGHGLISQSLWQDLKQLDAGRWFSNDFMHEGIPSLKDAVLTCQTLGLGANIEIKASSGRERQSGQCIAAVLMKHWPRALPTPLISSFSRECLDAAKNEAPDIARALIVRAIPPDWHETLIALGCQGLHCQYDLLDEVQVKDVIKAGFAVRCYTVNKRQTLPALVNWGVESVFTDYPDRLM